MTAATDPAATKRDRRYKRGRWLALMRPVWRRCWRSWPFGHDYGGGYITVNSTDVTRIARCRACLHPYTVDGFTIYDLRRLAEDMAAAGLIPEADVDAVDDALAHEGDR